MTMSATALTSSSLRNTLRVAANVSLHDESRGVFGELSRPEVVLSSLEFQENVGSLDDPSAAQAVTLHSITYAGDECLLEIGNTCATYRVRVRWMDERGRNPSTHQWTIEPSSMPFVQACRPGHLFLLSVVVGGEERVLGAYRPVGSLPSGAPHFLVVEQEPDTTDSFHVDVLLSETDDSLMVAASALDPVGFADKMTVPTLHTIVTNILKHPSDPKYRKLRISNRSIHHHIVSAWGAMHLLHLLGFRQTELATDEANQTTEQYLVLLNIPTEMQLTVMRDAMETLEVLLRRSDPDFVPELAPPPPWQTPRLSSGGSLASHWNTLGTHFVTPDERWGRTERWRGTGGRPPCRPSPGNAPSSRGTWGR